jgi:hypothetical protein
MNAVIFHMPPFFRLTGSLINAIEYFLCAVEYNPEFKLIILNGVTATRRRIINLIHNRYADLDKKWLDNIICIGKYRLIHKKLDIVLVLDYGTIRETKSILNANKILVISEKYTDRNEYFYEKHMYNVEYYGEMPFHYKDHDYRMKCHFDKYKTLDEEREGTYINSPYNNETYSLRLMFEGHVPEPIFFKSKEKHKDNLFENFTHYIYYHANKWFDPHPRLFLECAFYLKDIEYHNPEHVMDGSWYRYNDIIENGIYDRKLTKHDEIIRQLI